MSEADTKWERFIHWFNNATMPINYLTIVLGLVGIALSLLFGLYDLWLAASVIAVLWAAWDIRKWRRIKQEYRSKVSHRVTPIGPDDDPDFLRTI